MALIDARWLLLDSQSLMAGSSNVLQAKLVSTLGALERTSSGLNIKSQGILSSMIKASEIAFDRLADASNIARLDQTETVAAVWNFGTNLPTVSADPTTANQVTRKSYVDNLLTGLKWKEPVRAMAATNVTLSGVQTIDGVETLVDGDRVLLTGQTAPNQNGLWVMQTSTWVRPQDFAVGYDAAGTAVFVSEGDTYQDTEWFCSTDAAADVIGVNDLVFAQKGGSLITAGAGLVLNGNAFDLNPGQGLELSGDYITIDLDGTSLSKSANGLCVASGGITFAMLGATLVGTGASQVAAGAHDHGASEASASQYWGKNSSNALGWYNVPSLLGQRLIERFTISATDINNKYIILAAEVNTSAEVLLFIQGAGNQYYAADYVIDSGYKNRLKWEGLGLDGVLAENDHVTVMYN